MGDIHIADPLALEEKIRKIKGDGGKHLHVVSDFDRTLTPMFIDGEKAETGVGQIRAGGYLSPEYVKEAYALKDKYHPIEIDETIPLAERSKKMQEWWETHLQVMIHHGLNKEVIEDIIRKRKIVPRPGSLEFYDLLHRSNIPLLIFSASAGDLIEGFLKQEGRHYNNIHIISNFYEFDENGLVRGYKSGIIHSFNKNEGQVKNHPYHEQIKRRKNCMLLGDSIGDLGMTEGLDHDTILRIGFLNENAERSLSAFAKKFDVVISDDGPMDYVNDLLKRII